MKNIVQINTHAIEYGNTVKKNNHFRFGKHDAINSSVHVSIGWKSYEMFQTKLLTKLIRFEKQKNEFKVSNERLVVLPRVHAYRRFYNFRSLRAHNIYTYIKCVSTTGDVHFAVRSCFLLLFLSLSVYLFALLFSLLHIFNVVLHLWTNDSASVHCSRIRSLAPKINKRNRNPDMRPIN